MCSLLKILSFKEISFFSGFDINSYIFACLLVVLGHLKTSVRCVSEGFTFKLDK